MVNAAIAWNGRKVRRLMSRKVHALLLATFGPAKATTETGEHPGLSVCDGSVGHGCEDRRFVLLPRGYVLDESDPDVVTLRRRNATVVAHFSARGATARGSGSPPRRIAPATPQEADPDLRL